MIVVLVVVLRVFQKNSLITIIIYFVIAFLPASGEGSVGPSVGVNVDPLVGV